MSACDAWREALVEHVLGTPPSHALAAHLRECDACAAALAEWRARMQQIDLGIRQLAASQPSPDAAARTLAEVRSHRPERLAGIGWQMAAALLAGVVILASGVHWQVTRERREQTQQALAAAAALGRWRSPTQALLQPPMDTRTGNVPRLGAYFYELKLETDLYKERKKRS